MFDWLRGDKDARRARRRAKKVAGAASRTHIDRRWEQAMLLQGRIASRQLTAETRLNDLADAEFRVFSQWGEDGIIDWLASTVAVPNHRFIEFGVEDFREANCRFLTLNRNWRGLVMDGSAENMDALRRDEIFWRHDITAKTAFITAENINELIASENMNGPLGLLSVDIDGNDYWVWKAIEGLEPAIVSCEVNPVLGDMRPVTVPYDPAFQRFNAHWSGLCFGASIAALKHLAAEKGYRFVGTTSTGINAFFVREDLAAPVLERLENLRAYPSRHRDSRDKEGRLSHVGGRDRFELIGDCPVIDVATGERMLLGEIETPYSDEWLHLMS